ncbi:hypothetical protein RRG08_048285 [Elysia crispata]|uniref:Uncharacterized protein n=1 Tax=Elysia crispata TaxID=231223 RepID=A0AAE0ZTC8_9GAST|nr:hypothetical protein RRG08_048285 [Elysia crispata]
MYYQQSSRRQKRGQLTDFNPSTTAFFGTGTSSTGSITGRRGAVAIPITGRRDVKSVGCHTARQFSRFSDGLSIIIAFVPIDLSQDYRGLEFLVLMSPVENGPGLVKMPVFDLGKLDNGATDREYVQKDMHKTRLMEFARMDGWMDGERSHILCSSRAQVSPEGSSYLLGDAAALTKPPCYRVSCSP